MSTSDEFSDEERIDECHKNNDLVFVAKFVKNNPIILNKAKTPAVTHKKEKALLLLKNEIEGK